MKRSVVTFLLVALALTGWAQAIPVAQEYTMLYEFIDELIMDGICPRQTAIRPYTRGQIAAILQEAAAKDSLFSSRQREELAFYHEEFALELDTLPDYTVYGHANPCQWRRVSGQPVGKAGSAASKADFNLSLVDPSLHLKTENNMFKFSLAPILGMEMEIGKKGLLRHQWVGAEMRMDIAHHVAVWGSLRDHSYYGARMDNGAYLINRPGLQYKEATNTSGGHVGDYSDSRGGISAYAWWGSISVQREVIRWGETVHSSNILSGHAPAFPTVSLQLTPCRWFQFDYFHAWLISNRLDSTNYYLEVNTKGQLEKELRPSPKYMAANMFTFIPCKQLSFSIGNSIIYGEATPQAAYFIPIAFYKSLDHLLTKGVASENQNSQVFGSISIRPVDHLQLYGSLYVDECSFGRLKKSNPERNPISYLVGFNWSGWPVRGLSLKGEFARQYIACYTHSIDVLTYTSNSYNMGHYMGDNSQSVYGELLYRPVRGLSLKLSYTCDTKYNSYAYLRPTYEDGKRIREGGISEVLSQKPFRDRIFQNDVLAFQATYEVFQNVYARVGVQYNHARSFAPAAHHYCTQEAKEVETPLVSENRGQSAFGAAGLEGEALQNYYLNLFCPTYYQGRNLTAIMALSFHF